MLGIGDRYPVLNIGVGVGSAGAALAVPPFEGRPGISVYFMCEVQPYAHAWPPHFTYASYATA